MDISREIYIEKNGTSALEFIERYKRQTDGLTPDLIIFEFRSPGDLFFLDHMQQCDMQDSQLMVFHLHKTKLCAKYAQGGFCKSGYPKPSDVANILQEKIIKVA